MYTTIKKLIISETEKLLGSKLNDEINPTILDNFELNPKYGRKYLKQWCENKTFVLTEIKYTEHPNPRINSTEIKLYVSEYKKDGNIKNVKMYLTSLYIDDKNKVTVGF